ncbi:MAG: VWA domain-containing protein [candidate division Zixibacteria bacterium]|nr:VWA domain-containing protein [candidate division Zixibacteria bacterium]
MLEKTSNQKFTLTGLKRPDVINSKTKQRVVLVRDVSASMDDDNKAIDANKAIWGFLSELARPENKDGFYVAVVDYSKNAKVVSDFTKATDLEGQLADIKTLDSTNITAGLALAGNLLSQAPDPIEGKERFLKPVVVLFTDGEHNTGEMPYDEADQLKKTADLVTVAFGVDADLGLLQEIANSPEHCYRCGDGRDLRAFLAAVGETLASSMQMGQDATQPLGNITIETSNQSEMR